MVQVPQPSVQNSFIGGLKTEFTGLNFPENACTSADNVIFSLVGDVTRREGFDAEVNYNLNTNITSANVAQSTYRWLNAGGNGSSQILVHQVGAFLFFYLSSSATSAAPLSTTRLGSTVSLSSFWTGVSDPSQSECQYATGNGYLFVVHPNCEPFYCTYSSGVVSPIQISLSIRDTIGVFEGSATTFRPTTLSAEHNYNLFNQGWYTTGWSATSTTVNSCAQTGGGYSQSFTVASGLSITPGDLCVATAIGFPWTFSGSVLSYSGTTLTIGGNGNNVADVPPTFSNWSIIHTANTLISGWFSGTGGGPAQNNYPSNSDVWWTYKNASGVFSTSTVANFVPGQGPAPQGSFVLSAFNQDRSLASGVSGITKITTTVRPKTVAWYQGRAWYSGVDSSQAATGDAQFYTWSESIYYSQLDTSDVSSFGKCYQINDPTSETLFDALPTDGGVVVIPGSGSIYKLFPIKFGLLVFAANGIWYIGGSNALGFSSTDYTVTKISSIRATTGTSFIDVQGFPMFWNEEGIYYVSPSQQGGSARSPDIALDVQNLCIGTILSFYAGIPSISKKYARGDYHELDYIVQWCFRDTTENGIGNRYQFNRILNFNVVNKAFYTYTISQGVYNLNPFYVSDVKYIQSPGGSAAPDPIFKYIVTHPINKWVTFSEERDFIHWQDWGSFTPVDYTSSFITGYNLKGKALTKFQVPYTYMFSRNPDQNEYYISSIWDYAGTGNSGRWSVRQLINNNNSDFTMLYRRHRLRGRGLAVQLQISSVSGKPFDLMGWSMWNQINQGI